MRRITITHTDEFGEKINLGWFDLDATVVDLTEGTRWNGENHIGIISGLQLGQSSLYRTKGGRWIENVDARRQFNGPDRWTFLTDDQARAWLIKSEADGAQDILDKYFPDTPEESGPNLGGRPTVGPKVEVRLAPEILAEVDQRAKEAGVSRAEMLRTIVAEAIQD